MAIAQADFPEEPPRGEIFKSADARVAWAAIKHLDPGAQHEILEQLRNRLVLNEGLAEDTPNIRINRSVTSLRLAVDALGHSPSVNEYEKLRHERSDLQLVPAGTVRRSLSDDWSGCLTQAHLDPTPEGPDIIDFVVAPLGPRFSLEELSSALRECARELGYVPTIRDYVTWAKRPDVQSRPGRRPKSHAPFKRIGGFIAALQLAGLGGEDSPVPSDVVGRIRIARGSVDDAAIFAAVREVASRIGRVPNTQEYIYERERVIEETSQSGELRVLPSYAAITWRFGCWDEVLVGAGLKDGASARKRGGHRPHYSAEQLALFLKRARGEIGEIPSSPQYIEWQSAHRRPRGERESSPPTVQTIRSHFGGWSEALVAVFGEDPRLGQKRGRRRRAKDDESFNRGDGS